MADEDLRAEIAKLKEKIAALETEDTDTKQTQDSNFGFLVPIAITAIVSLVGVLATYVYNERQVQLAQIEALDKYREYLNSAESTERKFAYEVFKALGYKDLVLELIALRNDGAGVDVAFSIEKSGQSNASSRASVVTDALMANAILDSTKALPPKTLSQNIDQRKAGWVYLGHFDRSSKTWKTRYLDFEPDRQVKSLQGAKERVRSQTGALNVRNERPSLTGELGTVIDVLAADSYVTIEEIDQWYSSGYMWALVKYGGQ